MMLKTPLPPEYMYRLFIKGTYEVSYMHVSYIFPTSVWVVIDILRNGIKPVYMGNEQNWRGSLSIQIIMTLREKAINPDNENQPR